MRRVIAVYLIAILSAVGFATTARADVLVGAKSDAASAKVQKQLGIVLRERVGNVVVIDTSSSYNMRLPDGTLNHAARQALAAVAIESLGDHYDFVVVAPEFQVNLGAFIGLHWQVSNSVAGIGRPLLDLTSDYGSAGRLKAVIDLDESILQTGVTAGNYDDLLDTLMHEVMHQWVAYFDLQVIAGNPASQLTTPTWHWSSKYHSQASVMFGARWQPLADGRQRAIDIRDGYGPLDLYLAGMLDAAALPETRFLQTSELSGTELPELGRTVSADLIAVQPAQIIGALGARVPAAAQAQKHYTAALVLLARAGDALSPSSIDRLELLRVHAQSRFAAITLGRGDLRLGALPQSLPAGRGSAAPVLSTLGPAPALDLPLATAWVAAKQGTSGLWRDKAATTLFDTQRAMSALLANAGTHAQALANATQRLDSESASTVDRISLLLRAPGISAARRTQLVTALLAKRRDDGGWGLAGEFSSASLDTALALKALAQARSQSPTAVPAGVIEAASDLLLSRFRPVDQCWSAIESGPCDLLTSVHSVHALAAVVSAGDAAMFAQGLFRWQRSGAGFGADDQASAFETALVLNRMQEAGIAADPRVAAAETYLAGQQRSDGSWAGSVSATAESILWFVSRQRADLRVFGAISLAPIEPIQGQTIEFGFDAENAGSVAAAASDLVVEYRLSSATNWTAVPEPALLPALTPNQRVRLTGQFPSSALLAGSYLLRVRLDSSNSVLERDEANNVAELSLNLIAAPTLPDLTITLNSLQITPAVITTVPQQIAVNLDIENLGRTAVNGASIGFFGWRFGELRALTTVQRDVAAQSRIRVDQTVTVSDLDISRIVVVLDRDNLIAEANETNNQAHTIIDRQPTVDLAINASEVVMPSTAAQGTPTEFLVSIRNLGTRPSPITQLRAEVLRSDQSVVLLSQQDLQLEAGTLAQRRITWVADQAGPARLRVSVDPANTVAEISEDNNAIDLPFVVAVSTLPNLAVVPSSWVVNPNPALQGASVNLALTISNSSAHPAAPFNVEFLWANLGSSTYTSLGTARLNQGLAAGATQQVSLQSPVLTAASGRQLLARVDSGNEIAEGNEADNQSLSTLPVLTLPNLQISSVDTRLVPSNPQPGAAAVVTAIIRNTGEQAIPSAQVELRLGSGAGANTLAPAQTLNNLAAGSATTLQFNFVRPASGSSARIEVVGDRANAVVEGREDDNIAAIDLEVIDPNFYLTETYISPNADGIQDRTEIVARFDPPLAVRMRIVAPWGEEVARFGGAATPVANLSATWDGRRPDGRRALDDRYQVRIEDLTGRLIKLRTVVVDTNRSPLVHAARDGHAVVTPLSCTSNFSLPENGRTTLPGLNFAVEWLTLTNQGSNSEGLYRVHFDGSPPRPLLLRNSLPHHTIIIDSWLESDGSVLGVVLSSHVPGVGAHMRLLSSDTGQLLMASTKIADYARYLGTLQSGHRIFQDQNGPLIAVTGEGTQAVAVNNGEHVDTRFTPVVGQTHILAIRTINENSNPYSIKLELYDLHTKTTFDTDLLLYDTSFPVPRIQYSAISRSFIFATGMVNPSEIGLRHKIIEITEVGTMLVRDEADDGLANFTSSVSPSGNFTIMFRGLAATATLIDSRTGRQLAIDLAPAVPEQKDISPGEPVGRGIHRIFWSPDESKIAFQFEAYQYSDSSVEKQSNFFGQPKGISGVLLDVSSGEFRILEDFKPEGWISGELQLIGENKGIAIERGLEVFQLLPGAIDNNHVEHADTFTDGRSSILRTYTSTNTCGSTGVHALSSSANGIADILLEYVDVLRSFVITATATDLNLLRHSLSYRREGDSGWTELATGNNQLRDQFIASWSPPGPGRYTVRVRVIDLGGNEVNTDREIVWFESAPVGLVRSSEKVISPNGDGVQDTVTINYQLRAALSIGVRVEDLNGTAVRSENIVQSVPGSFNWIWDGRDQLGRVVVDGRYRLIFYDRVMEVLVDATLPTINVSFRELSNQNCANHFNSGFWERTVLNDKGLLRLNGFDKNWVSLTVQQRPKGLPGPWEILANQTDFKPDGNLVPLNLRLKPGELVDIELRAVGKDSGGNSTILPIQIPDLFRITSARQTYNQVPPPSVLGTQWGYDRRRTSANIQVLHNSPYFPNGIRLGLVSADLSGWRLQVQMFTTAPPLQLGSSWVDVPWRALSIEEDAASGGLLNRTCYGEREWLIAAEFPFVSNAKHAVVRMVRNVGNALVESNLVYFDSVGNGGGGIGIRIGDPVLDLEYCSRIGGESALLPYIGQTGSSVWWIDPRSGLEIQLPIESSSGNLIRISLGSLPAGEHRVVIRNPSVLDGNAFVGKDIARPSVVVDWPQNGAKVCVGGTQNDPVRATINESFLKDAGVSSWLAASPGSLHTQNLEVQRLIIPVSNAMALSTQNPHPLDLSVVQTIGSGPGYIRVHASDCFGEVNVLRSVIFDSELKVGVASAAIGAQSQHPPIMYPAHPIDTKIGFAPGLQQHLWLSVFASEHIEANAKVRRVGSRPVLTPQGVLGEWTASGSVIAELGARSYATGQFSWVWNGLDASGQMVPDGVYVAQITVSDVCGHIGNRWVAFFVDNTAPVTRWILPATGSTVALFEQLHAHTRDEHLPPISRDESRLDVRSLAGNWSSIMDGRVVRDSPVTGRDIFGIWHSNLAPGTYELRVTATDEVGNESEARVEVQVPQRQPMLVSAAVTPALFSPNNDGVIDTTRMTFNLGRTGLASLRVFNEVGIGIRSLLPESAMVGEVLRTWDGRNENSIVVADGNYELRLRVVDPSEALNIEEVNFPLTVDNTAPALSFVAPAGGYSNGRGPLSIDVIEPHLQSLTANATPAIPGFQTQSVLAGRLSLAQLDAAPEGSYQVAITADDLVGNSASLSHSFILDRTPPVVAISAPAAGAVLTRLPGAIGVAGSVADAHLASWQLRVVDLATTTSRVIASSDPAVAGAIQEQWEGNSADGDYRIELEALDLAGNRATQSVQVVLDNTPPTAQIDLPLASGFVGSSWSLTGTATDANFSRYEIDLASSSSPSTWNRVAADTTAVANGLLASLLSPQPDGSYLVRLRVTDAAGHSSEAFRDIQVDSVPPTAPLALTAQRLATRDVRLTWTASAAPDVHHYRVFRDSAAVFDTPGLGLTHVDAGLADGRYRYRVAAVDRAGNVSPMSPEAQVSIDTTPPEVRINRPAPAERLRGVIAVQGRAYSREDFERYELRALRIDQPGNAQVIGAAGSSVLAGELGRFDSSALAEAQIRLELQAWDTSGNHATQQVEFIVDNLPPAAPQGLSAQIEGNHIRLNWNPNIEADLKGYLVYRGPRLLQGDPSVDPRVLTITDPTWLDQNVGDGMHQWRAVAVDTTGNVSEFSEPVTVTRSGRPPRVNLVRPLNGERFDTRTLVRGQSADLDIAEVRFEARAESGGAWTAFGPLMSVPPWETDFVPALRAFGLYRLRAQSLDSEGLSDTAPPEITVDHRDLTAPPAPLTLNAMVDGDAVTLSWDAVSASDLAGYRIERANSAGEFSSRGCARAGDHLARQQCQRWWLSLPGACSR